MKKVSLILLVVMNFAGSIVCYMGRSYLSRPLTPDQVNEKLGVKTSMSARQVLGVSPTATANEIKTAYETRRASIVGLVKAQNRKGLYDRLEEIYKDALKH